MGTDVKSTAKDIKLTPGPGHYYRVDEQYPRTFHHATRHGTQASPVFSDKHQLSAKKGLSTEQQSLAENNEIDQVKLSLMGKKNSTVTNHFFGAPTGAVEFSNMMMMTGSTTKKVQPPMLTGKAKIPSDLSSVLNYNKMRHPHRTIEHHRTTSSFVNASLQDYHGRGQMSPIELEGGA